jgi:transcriptional regulator NrdR family protein
MVCVHCGGVTRVINSRAQKRSNRVWRRRQCVMCRLVFSTEESVQYENVWLVMDSSGTYSPFSSHKLQLSLYRSCQHRQTALNDAVALSKTIIQKLQPKFKDGLIDSQTIVQVSQVALNRFDRAASVNYGAYHHLKSRS